MGLTIANCDELIKDSFQEYKDAVSPSGKAAAMHNVNIWLDMRIYLTNRKGGDNNKRLRTYHE